MEEILKTSFERLEKTAKLHEKKIVIDLAMDRIIKYFGTYAVGILALATIIFAVIGKEYRISNKLHDLHCK